MIVVYDIEVLRDYFLYLDYDLDTGRISTYEVSQFDNELPALITHLSKIKAQIGYNNLAYDAQIIQHILVNYRSLSKLPTEEVTTFIHQYSSKVISNSNENKFADYYESKLKIPQLDLYKVWHYDNPQRRCSLKWLQYSMDWHNIEDMPIHHLDRVNTRELRDKVRFYCENDVMSTHAFYKISLGETEHVEYKGKNKIQFRKDITKRLGVSCRNFSDVKIGDEINKQNYLKATGKTWAEIKTGRTQPGRFTFGDCFPSYMQFQTEELNSFVDRIKDIYVDISSKQEFSLILDGVEYIMAKGGLHSKDKPRLIKPGVNQILKDADVGSMYPNGIRKRRLFPRHLGEAWLNGYANIIEERLNAKAEHKKTKDPALLSLVEAFKLALNGGSFGKTQEATNWQYDPFVTFCVTIGCQIDLLMLIESFILNGIRVMSANTDGVVCLFDKDMEDKYYEVCKEWERKVGNHDMGILEYADYALIAQTNVNHYIAVTTEGKAKQKGLFVTNPELHKNKSFRVVALALDAFYTKGIAPTKFIREHDNIFDFCAGVRAKENWHFEMRGIVDGSLEVLKLPKTNRYFISNQGHKLIKCNDLDGRTSQVDAGKWVCTLYNKHNPKPISEYGINYEFYIEETYKIISDIQPEIVSPTTTQLFLF